MTTSGIALLAISVFLSELFSRGIALLMLGILSFFAKEIVRTSEAYYEVSQERYIEGPEAALFFLYIVAMLALGGIVLYLFWPLL